MFEEAVAHYWNMARVKHICASKASMAIQYAEGIK